MRFLAYNFEFGLARYGESLYDISSCLPGFTYNEQERRIYYKGTPDTMSFGHDFTEAELDKEISKRVLVLAQERGWKLYKEVG